MLQMRSRPDSKDLCRLRRLRKALHTAVRLHRHSKLQSKKVASAHQATIQDPIKSQAQNELQDKTDALMDSVSTKHQDRFLRPPTEADEDAWANWEGKCVNERSKAAKQKERIVQVLRQKDGIAARRHIQTMYNSNQKQWNKIILKGDSNNVTLNAVLNKNSSQMLNDPNKITEYVHEAFQQQARPADGRTKTRKYLPEEANTIPGRQVPIVTLTHTPWKPKLVSLSMVNSPSWTTCGTPACITNK